MLPIAAGIIRCPRTGGLFPGMAYQPMARRACVHFSEKIIVLYRRDGKDRERLDSLIDRMGFQAFSKEVLREPGLSKNI